jgi:hypothetical protein
MLAQRGLFGGSFAQRTPIVSFSDVEPLARVMSQGIQTGREGGGEGAAPYLPLVMWVGGHGWDLVGSGRV